MNVIFIKEIANMLIRLQLHIRTGRSESKWRIEVGETCADPEGGTGGPDPP